MKLRPYRETDLPELVSLWNDGYRDDYEFIPYTEEKLRAELEGASTILIAVDEQDRILGFALLRREWYGEEIKLCVRPGPRQQGIEERLLSTIEPQVQTGQVTTIVDAEDQERIEFLTAKGYQPKSSFYQMITELAQSRPLPSVPSGYLLRGLRPDEEEALIRVVNTAYQGERLRRGVLARWRAEDPDFSEEWVQVAEYENRLVAAAVARADREFNAHYRAKRGYLGPAATLPAHQGKGLNKALTWRVMDLLQERGMRAVCLYTWEGNAAALSAVRSLGFQVGHQWRILTRSVVTLL